MLFRPRIALGFIAVLGAILLVAAHAPAQTGMWETPQSSDSSVGPAAGSQTDPYIAKGGDIFLAVWVDARTTVPSDEAEYASQRDVYAVRLDPSGEPIEEAPIVLSDDIQPESELTFYTRHGDFVAQISVLVLAVTLAVALRRRFRKPDPTP